MGGIRGELAVGARSGRSLVGLVTLSLRREGAGREGEAWDCGTGLSLMSLRSPHGGVEPLDRGSGWRELNPGVSDQPQK